MMFFRYVSLLLLIAGLSFPIYSQSQTIVLPRRNDVDLNHFFEDLFPIQSDGVDYQTVFENLAQLYSNPLDLNHATRDELAATYLLNESQLTSLIQYRQDYGDFLSIYELQAVPALDLATIRRLLPFVTVANGSLQNLASPTDNYLLLRYEQVLEQQRGFSAAEPDKNGKLPTRYLGNAQQWFARYRYNRPNVYSLGFSLEKDPGERITWNVPSHQYGPDYISFHAQLKNQGRWRNCLLGDYQMQVGQGLIFSAGFVMGKSSETILTVRRPTLGARPYTSLTEFGFFRGATVTYALTPSVEITLMGARNRRSANVIAGQNGAEAIISSLQTSGLHRTPSEVADRFSTLETNVGAHLLFHPTSRLQLGLTGLSTHYDKSLQKRSLDYNQYEFSGKHNLVIGIHGNYVWQNINFFGEIGRSSGSVTNSGGIGIISGAVASLTKRVDIAAVLRHYDRNFHSFYANAFGENTRNINETGSYLGLKYSVYRQWKVSGYMDIFRFPWWRYLVDKPSGGIDFLFQSTYTPNRQTTFSAIYHEEHKEKNKPGSKTTPKEVIGTSLRQLVLNAEYRLIKGLTLRSRVQGSIFRYRGQSPSQGIALVQDASYERGRWSLSGRFALFNTDDYDSRQYVYERDVLYAFSFPSYFYNGNRHYLLIQYNATRQLDLWLRWASTRLTNQTTVGSDLDRIDAPHKSELKLQARFKF